MINFEKTKDRLAKFFKSRGHLKNNSQIDAQHIIDTEIRPLVEALKLVKKDMEENEIIGGNAFCDGIGKHCDDKIFCAGQDECLYFKVRNAITSLGYLNGGDK